MPGSCLSPTPGACWNSCPPSRWCHPIISSSLIPFSSSLHFFPTSGSFPVNQFFASGGQSFSFNPSNKYSELISFRIDWFDLLAVQGLLRVFSNTTVQKHQFFGTQLSLWSNSYIHTWPLENHSFDYMDFVGKVMSLLFNMLSRLVIAFPPRSKHLLISWLQSPSAVILEPPK